MDNEFDAEQLAAQAEQFADWRRQDAQRLGETDNELWQQAVTDMTPMLSVFPTVIKECYPTLWSILN